MKSGFVKKYSCRSFYGTLPTEQHVKNVFKLYEDELVSDGLDKLKERLEEMKNPKAKVACRKKAAKGGALSKTKKTWLTNNKKEKVPNEPKRPSTAYMLYSKETHPLLKKENPGWKQTDVVSCFTYDLIFLFSFYLKTNEPLLED